MTDLLGHLSGVTVAYVSKWPGDVGRLAPLLDAIERGGDLGSRATMPLHVTASAVVFDPGMASVLMVEHAFLGKWLPPGGHLDPGELPEDAAARELVEEAGLVGTRIAPLDGPVDVDVHPIPRNPAKGEDAHFHADFAFVFVAVGSPEGNAESLAVAWRRRGTLASGDPRGERILARLGFAPA